MAKTRSQAITADIPRITEPEIGIPVADAIQAGIDLINKNKKTCNPKQVNVKPVYKNDVPQCPKCYIRKILYPEPNVFQGCKHGQSKFQLRMGINREHHLKELAQPNPVNTILWNIYKI